MSGADDKPTTTQEQLALPTATLDKYKAAAQVVANALQALIPKLVDGANIVELCNEGDKLIEQGTAKLYNKVKGIPKGLAFPTTLSVNSVLQNFSPVPTDTESEKTLKANDVVKVCMGAHIDGFPIISAETVVVSSETITDVRANLLQAAYQAGEAAIRAVKPGAKNWEVTEAIKKVLAEYDSAGIKGIEGVLSHQFEQNNIEAKKGIVATPSLQQRADSDNSYTFEEGEVYGLNLFVTNSTESNKFKTADTSRTTVFQKTTSSYALKMKASRATFSEISKKAGSFPFTLRVLEDEVKARMGVRECVSHGLLKSYDIITTEKSTDLSAQAFITFAVTKTGVARLSLPSTYFDADKIKSDVQVSEEVKALITKSLKPKPTKTKKAAADQTKA
ncbi:hypothetical protein OIO90_004916 [Microbotryomycetes sp. JL221]|nr:hypothetical protein OIO90_004916 [Microbotryomycetes sp. JL221]